MEALASGGGAVLAPASVVLDKRLKLLRLTLAHPHRYRRWRRGTMAMTVAVLFAVPLSGLARVDLWGGSHAALFRDSTLRDGLIAVLAAMAGFYGITFLVNIVAGRLFCGFGCPVSQLSRLADAVEAHPAGTRARRLASLRLVAFALLLSASVSLWWISPRALSEPLAAAAAAAAIALLAGYGVLHARLFRWRFCQKLCPIGWYYSMVQTPSLVVVDFDPRAECSDCEACSGICPVQLDPRHLESHTPAPGGIAFDDLPGRARCLQCGTCIEMCEYMSRRHTGAAPLGFRRPRRAGASSTPAA